MPTNSKVISALTWGITAMTAVLVAGVFLGHYTQRVPSVGWLSSTPGASTIPAQRTGVIGKVFVHDGDVVQVGQELVEINGSRSTSGVDDVDETIVNRLQDERASLVQQIAVSGDLIQGDREQGQAQIAALESAVRESSRIARLAAEKVQLSEADKTRIVDLVARGYMAAKAVDDADRELLATRTALALAEKEVQERQSALKQARVGLRTIPFQTKRRELELRERLAQLDQRITEATATGQAVLRAPIAGRISGLALDSGQYVTAGSKLMSILPEGATLKAELLVPSRSAGFLKEGMEVWLRYDAFPYQKFGQHRGHVSSVDRTVLSPVEQLGPTRLSETAFRVTVALDDQTIRAYGQDFALRSGLSVQASIVHDRRRIIQWILDPLYVLGTYL